MGQRDKKTEIPPGTLDMLILKTLANGAMHGYGIAERIHQLSREVLVIEEGSLYPALQRMLVKGWVVAEWRPSENNRRARYYTLKIVVFAPMPRARVRMAMAVKPGDLRNMRIPYRRS